MAKSSGWMTEREIEQKATEYLGSRIAIMNKIHRKKEIIQTLHITTQNVSNLLKNKR